MVGPRLLCRLALLVLASAVPALAGQQPPLPRPALPGQIDPLPPGEVQRLFDAYFVVQAQTALQLDDAQFVQFLPRLQALQQTRRRSDQARHQLIAGMGRMTAPGLTIDENALKEKLRALQELDGRAAAELRRAYDTIDQVLDVRRQARFRVFEQQIERRKFDLLLRARGAAASRIR